MAPPWGAFCQITLTSCLLYGNENCVYVSTYDWHLLPTVLLLVVSGWVGWGWVHIFRFAMGWVGLGRVAENGPTDNSDSFSLLWWIKLCVKRLWIFKLAADLKLQSAVRTPLKFAGKWVIPCSCCLTRRCLHVSLCSVQWIYFCLFVVVFLSYVAVVEPWSQLYDTTAMRAHFLIASRERRAFSFYTSAYLHWPGAQCFRLVR